MPGRAGTRRRALAGRTRKALSRRWAGGRECTGSGRSWRRRSIVRWPARARSWQCRDVIEQDVPLAEERTRDELDLPALADDDALDVVEERRGEAVPRRALDAAGVCLTDGRCGRAGLELFGLVPDRGNAASHLEGSSAGRPACPQSTLVSAPAEAERSGARVRRRPAGDRGLTVPCAILGRTTRPWVPCWRQTGVRR